MAPEIGGPKIGDLVRVEECNFGVAAHVGAIGRFVGFDAVYGAYHVRLSDLSLSGDLDNVCEAPKITPAPDAPAEAQPPASCEVPLEDLRPGDTISGAWSPVEVEGQSVVLGAGWLVDPVVTRPVVPLPTEPGSVGTATVRGVPGATVFRIREADPAMHKAWVSADLVRGSRWHADVDLADYVPVRS